MKVSVTESEKCQKSIAIEVPQEAIAKEFSCFFQQARKSAQIAGFRKGKAPLNLVEQRFAAEAQEHVLKNLITDHYQKAVEQEKIVPVSLPQISKVDFQREGSLSFVATVDVQPEFDLKNYRGIPLSRKSVAVADAEVEKVLGYLRDRNARFEPVVGRLSRMGDYLIADYRYSVDGQEKMKKERVWLWISDPLFLPGLPQELEGIAAGQTKEFSLAAPGDFQDKDMAGKNVCFTVTVHEIKEKQLPELDDDFAQTAGKQSMAELKEQIARELRQEKEGQNKQDLRRQIIDYLVGEMPVDAPPDILSRRQQHLRENARKRLQDQGVSEDRIREEEAKAAELIETEALKQVRSFFILERIAKAEGIQVTEAELQQRIEGLAHAYRKSVEEVFSQLEERGLLEDIHWEAQEEKILNFLTEQAVIQDVSEPASAAAA